MYNKSVLNFIKGKDMLKKILSISLLFFIAGCQQTSPLKISADNTQKLDPESVRDAIQRAQQQVIVKRNSDSEFLLGQNQEQYNKTSLYSDAPFNLAVKSVEAYIKDWLLRPTEVEPITLSMPQKPSTPKAKVLTKGEFETTKQFQVRLAEEKAKYRKVLAKIRGDYIAKVAAYNAAIKFYNSEIKWEQKIREERVTSIRVRLLGIAINEVLGEPKLTNLEYNADKEIFNAKVVATNAAVAYDIFIPVAIVDAPGFKENIKQFSVAIKMDIEGKIKPVTFTIDNGSGVNYIAYLTDSKNADLVTKERSTGVNYLDVNDVIINKADTLKVDSIIDRNEKYFGKFF